MVAAQKRLSVKIGLNNIFHRAFDTTRCTFECMESSQTSNRYVKFMMEDTAV
jgi:hypothetical protein